MKLRAVNLGCGDRFHPEWDNLDFFSHAPEVRAHDLRKGIPYPDQTFDAVYHSHLLEHFSREQAPIFLKECHRVLKTGGVIRVAVPDLEAIARLYLEALQKASQGSSRWAENYDWMMLEMYDQAVREHSGGSCNEYYSQNPVPNWDFVHERVGAEADAALAFVRAAARQASQPVRFQSKLGYILKNLRKFLQNRLAKLFLNGEDYKALQIGRFRKQGEVHLWMYDAYSLAQLLRSAGFCNPQRRQPNESLIPNWGRFHLDAGRDGRAHKPDSLYMEAVKP